MRDPLERYYENELTFVRRLGVEFARERPKIADRLALDRETGVADDPHVERLIEAFAFLAARVRLKIDDEFPELTESLLAALYPHYLAPIPSLAVVQFEVDPERGKLPAGHPIPRHSRLESRTVDGLACRFRTTAPVTLWPLEVARGRFQTTPFGKDVTPPPRAALSRALIRLELAAGAGGTVDELELDRLRFFISGDDQLVHKLYELIFNHVTAVVVRNGQGPGAPEPLVLGPECLEPVGFARDEGLLPYPQRSFLGYRLLTEYFAFPAKFMFFDVTGLERLRSRRFGNQLEILLFLNRTLPNLEPAVSAETFRLGCTPIVNLFEQDADPIRVSQAKSEYHIIPDVRHHRSMEVYSVDLVTSVNAETQQTTEYLPFFSFQHGFDPGDGVAYWYATRRPSLRKNDGGSEVFLSLVDLNFNPALPPAEVLNLHVTCSNRDLPGQLRAAGGEDWGFQLLGQAPYRRIMPVVPPTTPLRIPPGELRWRLISHLALNHLSIADEADGAQALREILRVYDYASTRVTQQHIDGVARVSCQRRVAPVRDGTGQGFCRGLEVTVDFDEEKFAGSGVYLFAAVLERFLALYTSINSATRLSARLAGREGYLKRWPFRSGERTLV